MQPNNSRRQFLQQATGASLATLGAALSPLAFSSPAQAIEPIARTAGHHFKFSLAAYSYRKQLSGDKPELTLVDFIDDCAKMGLDGTELTSYYFPKEPTPEFLRSLKSAAFTRGLDVSGTAVGNDFCHPPGETRDQQIASVKTWVDRAAILGAPVIRIFSGNVKEGQSVEEAEQQAVTAMEECCDYAGQHGVFLALENHGGLTATAAGLLSLVKAVKSPWFGVNLDTGNFHSDDPYGELAQLAPYAINVQIKVVMKPTGGKVEPADFSRLAGMLRESGYRGYIVLEYEEAGDPRVECPKFMEQLRAAFV
jgi:sugar phosphate isomerase/epimerase